MVLLKQDHSLLFFHIFPTTGRLLPILFGFFHLLRYGSSCDIIAEFGKSDRAYKMNFISTYCKNVDCGEVFWDYA